MTKEQKIEKVRQVMKQTYPNMHAMAGKIVSALEEPEERFLQNEVVTFWGAGFFKLYRDIRPHTDKELSKLRPEILAATAGARIPDAKWTAVDDNRSMYFYTDEPDASYKDGCWIGTKCTNDFNDPYRIHCPVDDWSIAKWRLE